MKYFIFFVFLYCCSLHSQTDLNSALKKYANKEWYNLELDGDEFVYKDFCYPVRFMFDAKEVFIMNDRESDKDKIDTIIFNKAEKTLIIFATRKDGISEKITISDSSVKGKNVVVIDVILYKGDQDSHIIYTIKMTAVLQKNLKSFRREALCKADVDTEVMSPMDIAPPSSK